MYFKSLELIGFKSFAEKTKLNFEPGVTAIVGPNGCGKSNIADSIRWALGEQSSKSLRASKMEDVIFNGTDTKDPINVAEVSITLSNEKRILPIDYDEVTITRRVYRSGETEYLINKAVVRLKDINDLLMGTGIGTESYSIIEQGKMDLILSSKPEDRRYVFEEASGITKYKSKKKEALRKLEQTEQNLLRVNDIILEVKRQIGSIERQARKAERYKVDFDKLKELEEKLSFVEYRDLKTKEKTYAVEGDDARTRQKEYEAELVTVSARIDEMRRALAAASQAYAELKNTKTTLQGSLTLNTRTIEIDRERIDETRLAQASLAKEVETTRDKVTQVKALVDQLRQTLERIVHERQQEEEAVAQKSTFSQTLANEMTTLEEEAKAAKLRIVDYLAQETKFKNELIKLGADIQNRNARQRRLILEKESVTKELGTLSQELAGIVQEFETVDANTARLRSDLEVKKNASDALEREVKELDSTIAENATLGAALQSKITFFEDMIKRHEGFNHGVKNLLAKLDAGDAAFSGILGVLANLITVTPGYEEAVNTVLASDAQLVITARESDSVAAIEYLRANRLGKASLLSLETVERFQRMRPASANAAPAGSMPLRRFVQAPDQFAVLLDYLFRDVYLAESLERDIAAIDQSHPATFVTSTGSMYERGRLSGGGRTEGEEFLLVGRRDKIGALGRDLESARAQGAALAESRRTKGDALYTLTAEIQLLDADLHNQEIARANIKVKKDAQEESAKKLQDELSVVELELDEVAQAVVELTKRGEDYNTQLNTIGQEAATLQATIDGSHAQVAAKRLQREQLALEVATLQARLTADGKEEETVRQSVKKEEAFLFELEEMHYAKEALLKEHAEKLRILGEEITRLEAQNVTVTAELATIDTDLVAKEASRTELAATLSIEEIQLKDRERILESLKNQLRDLDVKMTELGYKKTNLRERMFQAYKTDLETLHCDIDDATDWEAFRSQVAELKDRLDKMGPVNLIAIDEHKELEERYAFLSHQQEDLLGAKDSLLKAIQKINKTTKDLFVETFQKIQVEFKSFFRLLFGGGQAELLLIDEQDVLESGIEIIVRPPGKKLQNIMLLSGGEKAMTAISLLFAIFKVKPSPFCVLDEIDAPLDESNVVRFSTVLKELLKMSQFIIITHNKRTIELADVMYGITMQERGVSKIVSVKFLDDHKNNRTNASPVAEAVAAAAAQNEEAVSASSAPTASPVSAEDAALPPQS